MPCPLLALRPVWQTGPEVPFSAARTVTACSEMTHATAVPEGHLRPGFRWTHNHRHVAVPRGRCCPFPSGPSATGLAPFRVTVRSEAGAPLALPAGGGGGGNV